MFDVFYPTLTQEDPLVAQLDDLVDTMAGHHHCRALLNELFDCFQKDPGKLPIERRYRLIQEQQPWPHRQGSGERDALTLTAGEVAWKFMQFIAELHTLEPFDGTRVSGTVVRAS